jgi:AGZA family xanthine/uracil permease-like MFS transporter
MLERLFKLTEHGTNVRTEARAGLVTFFTMSYIIFLQPVVLAGAGMDAGAVMTATCLASALATFLMAFGANYPVALAPCMGESFFFVSVAGLTIAGAKVGWRAALAAVFLSGVLFLVLSLFKVRERIFTGVRHVAWDDPTEAIPAFLVIVGMPFTYNIATGLAFGFIAYPLLKLLTGRGREVGWLVYVLGVVFAGHLILVVRYH